MTSMEPRDVFSSSALSGVSHEQTMSQLKPVLGLGILPPSSAVSSSISGPMPQGARISTKSSKISFDRLKQFDKLSQIMRTRESTAPQTVTQTSVAKDLSSRLYSVNSENVVAGLSCRGGPSSAPIKPCLFKKIGVSARVVPPAMSALRTAPHQILEQGPSGTSVQTHSEQAGVPATKKIAVPTHRHATRLASAAAAAAAASSTTSEKVCSNATAQTSNMLVAMNQTSHLYSAPSRISERTSSIAKSATTAPDIKGILTHSPTQPLPQKAAFFAQDSLTSIPPSVGTSTEMLPVTHGHALASSSGDIQRGAEGTGVFPLGKSVLALTQSSLTARLTGGTKRKLPVNTESPPKKASLKRAGNTSSSTGVPGVTETKVNGAPAYVVRTKTSTITFPVIRCRDISPEDFLVKLMKQLGYETDRTPSLASEFKTIPTEKQINDYDIVFVDAIRTSNLDVIRRLHREGRSMNACNKYGESVLHMACRRADCELVKLLVELGASLVISDDFGRTALHDACWTPEPCFDVVTFLLDHEIRLLRLIDSRGSSPLAYIRREHYGIWCSFLEAHRERWWSTA